jgi:hypothetical protein
MRGDRIRAFWSRFSLRDLAPFLAAVFCTFTVFGFLRDVQSLGRFRAERFMTRGGAR